MDVNECKYGCGTCSKYLDGDCGLETNGKQPAGCVYGNGRGVTAEQVEEDEVIVHCWNCSYEGICTMAASNYICWNGKCIYQR